MIQYRALFNTVRDAIIIANVDTGIIVDANRAAEALCGRSIAELQSLHHSQLHPPEASEAARSGFEKDALVPGVTEGTVLHKDGHRIPVEIASSHFTGADGRLMLVGVFRDITERKRAQETLRESEKQFRVLTENLQSAVALVDERGEFTIVNNSFLRMFDFPSDAEIMNVNNRDWAQWQVYDERGRLLDVDEHPVRKAALARTAVKNQLVAAKPPSSPDLKWLLVSAEPILDAHGSLHRLICTYYDITERKRAEEALRESEELYRTLFDQSGDCVLLIRLDDGVPVIAGANQAALKSHGYSEEEMVGQPLSLIEPEFSQEALEARMRLVAEGKPIYTVHRRKDGSSFEVESVARRVTIGIQDIILAVGRNISERKQAERELLRQNEFIQATLDNISDGSWLATRPAISRSSIGLRGNGTESTLSNCRPISGPRIMISAALTVQPLLLLTPSR